MTQVAGLLSGPGAVRAGGHAKDVYPQGRYLHQVQHVQPPEEDRVDGKEVAGQQALGLGAQELPPGGAQAAEQAGRAVRGESGERSPR
jgi:hypothetical protein